MVTAPAARATSQRRLTGADKGRLAAFGGAVFLINATGWGLLSYSLLVGHAKGLTIAIGLTAWSLGLRHAFDADHISAIDNVTRKLLADDKRPMGVGFFFSLGHSTIVFALGVASPSPPKPSSGDRRAIGTLTSVGGYIGTSVSAFFLYLIAAINLVILVGIYPHLQRDAPRCLRRGDSREEAAGPWLPQPSPGPRRARDPPSWQMYPVGLLFGLGFDTATEVGLPGAGRRDGCAGASLVRQSLSLPILFAEACP